MAIKIPQREQQTVLQSTQAARPSVSGPVRSAYSAQEARAMQTVSDGLSQWGKVLYDLDRQKQALNLSAFEAEAQLAAKRFDDELKSSNDYLSFGQKYTDFENSIEEMGRTRLGDSAYANWAATKGKMFMGGIQLNTAQLTAEKKGVAMKDELAQNLNDWATLASLANTPEAFEAYSKQAEKALSEAYAPKDGSAPLINEQEKLTLMDNYKRAVGEATLTQDIENNPQMALKNLKNPKMYDFFTPQERQRWIAKVQREIESQKGTIKEKAINDFLTQFNILRQTDTTKAQYLYEEFINKPSDMQLKYGLTGQQLSTARNYMKSSLEEGDLGREKQDNFATVQIRYKDMGLDADGNFAEKRNGVEYEQPSVEEMSALITDIKSGLSGGKFSSSDINKAIDLINGLRFALGKQIKEKNVSFGQKNRRLVYRRGK